jgi:deoxyribose-phosphate aldolase
MVAAGATRIGTSGGVGIMRDLRDGSLTAAQSEGY